MRDWALWRLPATALILMFAVILAAGVLLAASWLAPVGIRDITHGFLWASLSITYSMLARHLETVRRALVADPTPNLLGVWTFAAALDVHLPVALAVTVIGYAAQWPARRSADRRQALPPHRYVYSTAVMILAVTAAHATWHLSLPVAADLGLAFLALTAVNIGGVAAMLALTAPGRLRGLASPHQHALQALTYLIGAAAVGLVDLGYSASAMSLLAALAAQQVATRRELLHPRNLDLRTRVLREHAWLKLATTRAAQYRHTAVIRVDVPDHDRAACARILISECRSTTTDHIGRWGDGFAIALPGVDSTVVAQVAYRLEPLLLQAGIDAVVFTGSCPEDAATLLGLVTLLDTAVMLAARATVSAA